MAQGTFPKCIQYIFAEEGGFSDNPADPGGATNMGITQATLAAWQGQAVTLEDVEDLSRQTATAIYQEEYWDKIDGDNLPAGLDYAVFDFAVNSGPPRAAMTLQEIVGVAADGLIGIQTIQAVDSQSTEYLINTLCDRRLAWLQTLSTFNTFGNGWTGRVERVRTRALALAGGSSAGPAIVPGEPAPGKAWQNSTSLASIVAKPEVLGSVGAVASGIAAITTGQYSFVGAMILSAAVGIWHFVQRVRSEP
ncbi:glycoside hydrolase family 108 protein [Phyllobacterium leguminum]|uniref:Lysozyme family protein n=1 Tax=Phyllobacterium leguminum TaxID=314237 RepID=A0A318TAK2_9HYPH|nr:glycoside hydrolase family 108 protein [Phyllobacterium leguminum]PYE87868.1 lysozyme family protein [Phyllobacterium leguminum]